MKQDYLDNIISAGNDFSRHNMCLIPQQPKVKPCAKCGAELKDAAKVCPHCGASQEN